MRSNKEAILARMLETDSEKVSPPPSWYTYLSLLLAGLVIMGFYYLFSEWETSLVFIGLAIILDIAMYIYRRRVLSKKIDSMPEEELFKYITKTRFTKCTLCDKEPSKTGNYTNMFLSKIYDPEKFNTAHGMMCAHHAGEKSKKIMEEKRLSVKNLEIAYRKAVKVIERDFQQLGK